MPEPNDPVELGKLGDLLADPKTRRDFFEDPDAALTAAEIDVAGIPDAFLDALRELDLDELGTLSRVNRKLVEAEGGPIYVMWPV
jgi:hypothetical protein